jgi:hypothetical protein
MDRFDPAAFPEFQLTERSIDAHGHVRLGYALGEHRFVEELGLPVGAGGPAMPESVAPLLALLHWVAGVSYYKLAAPPAVAVAGDDPPPAAAALLDALYSEGLGEFAVVNGLAQLPRPRFPVGGGPMGAEAVGGAPAAGPIRSPLVLVGGGKDSIVALEIVRASGLAVTLLSVRDDAAMRRTADAAALPRLVVHRRLPLGQLRELGARGALNGHVPITAIIACTALLTAALHGHDAVVLANERSASEGNLVHDGVEVNHQFSKSARAEALLRAAAAEAAPGIAIFSVLRPASELGIARRFATLTGYHRAFTSCNAVFRLDPALRARSWCADCPKCRFVFLALAPFMEPDALAAIFGAAMLDDEDQYEGFALLAAEGGHKPFECVGEEDECLAALSLLAGDPRWRDRPVVRRLLDEVLAPRGDDGGRVRRALALSDEHFVPAPLIEHVHALLGA